MREVKRGSYIEKGREVERERKREVERLRRGRGRECVWGAT